MVSSSDICFSLSLSDEAPDKRKTKCKMKWQYTFSEYTEQEMIKMAVNCFIIQANNLR